MPKKSLRKRWTEKGVFELKNYIKSKSDLLVSNFYENIIEGRMKVRKPPGFFIEMAQALKMTPKQCKSKFQKTEKEIYTKYLEFDDEEYEVFIHLRKKNYFAKKQKFKNKKKQINKIKDNDSSLTNKIKTRRRRTRYSETKLRSVKNTQSRDKDKNKTKKIRLYKLRKKMIKKYENKLIHNFVIEESNQSFLYFL